MHRVYPHYSGNNLKLRSQRLPSTSWEHALQLLLGIFAERLWIDDVEGNDQVALDGGGAWHALAFHHRIARRRRHPLHVDAQRLTREMQQVESEARQRVD